MVGPGIYIEDNSGGPILLKSYVDVRSMDGAIATKIVASTNTEHLFGCADKSSMYGFTFSGPTGDNKGAIYINGACEINIEDSFFDTCNIGIYCNNASVHQFAKRIKFLGTLDECIRIN